MTVPLIQIEELERGLPDVKFFAGDFIDVDLSYENREFSVRFYKVKDDTGIYWLCNPTRVHEKEKIKLVENEKLVA